MSKLISALSMLGAAGFFGVALAAAPPASPGASPAASPKDVMAHHIDAVKKDDVAAIMKDYADDAVIVRGTETFIGAANIRKFFERLAAQHRDWNALIFTQEVQEQGVVFQKELKSGKLEVYVVRDGKIAFQTIPG